MTFLKQRDKIKITFTPEKFKKTIDENRTNQTTKHEIFSDH